MDIHIITAQGLAKRRSPGLVIFVAAVAYHLTAAFTQPGNHLLAGPCILHYYYQDLWQISA